MSVVHILQNYWQESHGHLEGLPYGLLISFLGLALLSLFVLVYLAVFIAAPIPRIPFPGEKTYRTILPNGDISENRQLPCWYDQWKARVEVHVQNGNRQADVHYIEPAEVYISVVVPAYNEEERLGGMLEEAVDFLVKEYGDAHGVGSKTGTNGSASPSTGRDTDTVSGWEILIISDGSSDRTEEIGLRFAKDHQLEHYPHKTRGPWKSTTRGGQIPHSSIRVVRLEENRGKGGAVTHGMRHVRGQYVVFADADGASKFDDLTALIRGCKAMEDSLGRGVAIGSRAHLVGSEVVVKRSKLRNFLMHSFHLFIRLLTTRKTSMVKDTQCGFKLFSRPSLPYIIPYMHSEGWIFDVEMLMLAESADIPMVEVPIGWKEVAGSKLNVIKDSINMAWGLAILRVSWILGVYSRS